jgi:serine/threonine-protein kinase
VLIPECLSALGSCGQLIAGKYELIRLLGRGSMGEVWVARHRTLDHDVALKLLTRPPWGGDIEDAATAAARFRFEAQVAARLSHKTRHIVGVTDHGEEEDGLAYLVMELLSGQTLESRLMHRGNMAPAEVSGIVTQIARALDEAHAEGLVHRDLKPGNVFLTRDEDGGLLVKLLDFGIARTMRPHRVEQGFATAPGVVFGTPGYMSPEQARASSEVDRHCDLWALATVAYEALTGELPVPGSHAGELLFNLQAGRLVPVRERMPDLPPSVGEFFLRAFSPRFEDRYASASELAAAFDRAATQREARREEPPPISAPSSSGRGATLRMRTLFMDGPAWVSPRRSGQHRALGSRVFGGAALVLLGFAGLEAASLVQGRSRSQTSSTPSSALELVVTGPGSGVVASTAESTRAEQTAIGTVPPPATERASVATPPPHHRFVATAAPSDATPKAAPTVTTSPPAAPDCRLPYKFDSNGQKRWKLECL